MTAIISYLRAQKPVHNEVPKHDLNAIGKVINAFMIKPVGPSEEVRSTVVADTTAEYGRYLVHNLANCGGCHTKRDIKGTLVAAEFAGGNPMKNGDGPALTPPNLTPDSTGQIFTWSQDMFVKRFRLGALKHSEMPWNTFKRMTDDELKAIYKYLKTLKPAKTA